jgi:hypothetical protein
MDDFVINVRQIGNYKQLQYIGANDLLLVQQGGLGGPYACVSQDGLLGQVFERVNVGILPAPDNQGIASSYLITPLGQRQGFNWYVDEDGVQRYLQNGTALYQSFTGSTLTWAAAPSGEKDDPIDTTMWAPVFSIGAGGGLTVSQLTITGTPSAPTDAATVGYVTAHTVASFNTRTGAVTLTLADVTGVGGAPIASPALTGAPTAPTVSTGDSSTAIATTAFVHNAVAAGVATGVTSFNTRTGAVSLTLADVTGVGGAPIAGPAFTGAPTAPTPAGSDNSTAIATTAFVRANFVATGGLTGFAPINSPAFTGIPTGPTPAPGNSTGQLATTAFVTAAVVASTAGVASFNTRTGAVTLTTADITGAGGAPLAGPVFTGVPQAPTAGAGTATTQIATCAFVSAAISASTAGVSSFNGRTGSVTLTAGDVTGVGGALLASPAFSGVPTAPTAAPGTNTTQLATTAFVMATAAVSAFNGRTGSVTLLSTDISAAGGALLTSPAFTGTPTAPTAVPATNTTQVATTAFVTAALVAAGGVTTFNGRGGAVTLLTTDITGAGGAPINSPIFTGTPASVTTAPGNNSTAIATTAFVTAALAAAVVSFNGRVGAVTLTLADVTGVGGAPLASPAFTGIPTAPTASPGTNTTQLATTAFVQAYTPTSISSAVVIANEINVAASISLAAGFNGSITNVTASSAITLTLPNNLAQGFYCTVVQSGAGQITFAPAAGATLNNRQGLTHSAGQYAACSLIVTSNSGGASAVYVLGGDCA